MYTGYTVYGHNTYYMKIWNETEVSVAGTNDNTIGYYEDRESHLGMINGITLLPFKRCLSYQNFICCYRSEIVDLPNDFSSELGNPDEWATARKDLMLMRFSLQKDIILESAEVDDEDI